MSASFFTLKLNYSPKHMLHFRAKIKCVKIANRNCTELCFETKSTKLYSKMLLLKNSENNFVFSPAFYLIIFFMKAPKNFGKRAILKI